MQKVIVITNDQTKGNIAIICYDPKTMGKNLVVMIIVMEI